MSKLLISIEDLIYQQLQFEEEFYDSTGESQVFPNYGSEARVIDNKLKQFINPYKQLIVSSEQTIENKEKFIKHICLLIQLLDQPISFRIQKIFIDQTKFNYYMVTESQDQSVSFNAQTQDPLSEQATAQIIKQLLNAVTFYHEKGVVHRNICPESIFITDREIGLIKLGGFQFLTQFTSGKQVEDANQQFNSRCYPPEYFQNNQYNELIDEWCVGLIMLTLLQQKDPFQDFSLNDIEKIIKEGNFNLETLQIDQSAKDLLQQLLTIQPEKRIKAAKALEHPWIKENGKINDTLIQISFQEMLEVCESFMNADILQQAIILYIANYSPCIFYQEQLNVIRLAGLDSNTQGYVTQQMLEKAFTSVSANPEEGKQKTEKIMKFFNINNDGKIPYSVFIAMSQKKQDLHNYEYLQIAFSHFDADQDGFLTLDDLKLSFRGANKYEQEFKVLLNKYDLNKDGAISFNEFQLIMFQLLEKDEQMYDYVKVDMLNDKKYYPKGYYPFDLNKLDGFQNAKKVFLQMKQFFYDYQLDIQEIAYSFDNYSQEWDKQQMFPQLMNVFDPKLSQQEIDELFNLLDFEQKGYVSENDIKLAFPIVKQ